MRFDIKAAWLVLWSFSQAFRFLDWGMAIRFQEAEDDVQHSLRVGDTVLLYVKETNGYVFSELSRYVAPKK